MRSSLIVAVPALLGTAAAQVCNSQVLSDCTLANWMADAVSSRLLQLHESFAKSNKTLIEFQPTHAGWDTYYDQFFSKDLVATFNSTHYNFTTFKALYGEVYQLVSAEFKDFQINITNAVGVPDPGTKGGRVYALGIEGGHLKSNGALVLATDGTFVQINDVGSGVLQIVEMRESNNFPTA